MAASGEPWPLWPSVGRVEYPQAMWQVPYRVDHQPRHGTPPPDFIPAPSPAVAVPGRLNAVCSVCGHAVIKTHVNATGYGERPNCVGCGECAG